MAITTFIDNSGTTLADRDAAIAANGKRRTAEGTVVILIPEKADPEPLATSKAAVELKGDAVTDEAALPAVTADDNGDIIEVGTTQPRQLFRVIDGQWKLDPEYAGTFTNAAAYAAVTPTAAQVEARSNFLILDDDTVVYASTETPGGFRKLHEQTIGVRPLVSSQYATAAEATAAATLDGTWILTDQTGTPARNGIWHVNEFGDIQQVVSFSATTTGGTGTLSGAEIVALLNGELGQTRWQDIVSEDFEHIQTIVSTLWTINHNRGTDVESVAAFDATGRMIEGTVNQINTNTVNITFGVAVAGRATVEFRQE